MTTMSGASGWDLLAGITSVVTPGFAAGLVLKTSALLLVTGAVATVLGRRSAAVRHFIWSLALGGALALPLVATSLPWSLAVVPVPGEAVTSSTPAQPASWKASAAERDGPAEAERSAALTVRSEADLERASSIVSVGVSAPRGALPTLSGLGVRAVAGIVWALVAVALLLHLVAGRIFLGLMARRGRVVRDASVASDFRRMLGSSGIRRPVRLLWSQRVRVPLTWGVLRPVILLPAEARGWEHERLALVLRHELAHVRRLDDVAHLVAWIACALHWFNPLVWWAASRMRDESEHASDDLVLQGGARASDYARHLLAVVSAMGSRSAPAGAVPLAQRSRFEGRLLAILDAGRSRDRVHGPGAVGLAVGTAALVVLLGAMAPAPARGAQDPVGPMGSIGSMGSMGSMDPPGVAEPTSRVQPPQTAGRDEAETDGSSPDLVAADAPMAADPSKQSRIDSDTEVDQDAAGAVPAPANGSPKGSWPAVVDHVEDDAAARRDSASVRALSKALLEDSDAEVRRSAAWALGQLEDRRGTPALSSALRGDDAVEVRRTAAWALGQVEDASAVDALGDALDDTDEEVRSNALWALGQIESPEAVAPLTRVLRDGSPEARRTAAWALGQIESREAVAPLVAALKDADEDVRDQAVWALGQIEDDAAVPPLLSLLQDVSAKVRRQAAWALGQIESPRAASALAGALADTDPEVATTAAWALGQIEPSTAPPELLQAARTGTGDLRNTALWALSQIEDPAAVPIYAELLKDSDPRVRATALRGLAEVRDEAAIRAITQLLEDPDPEVRAAAVRALAGHGGWGGDPRPQPRPRPRPRPNGW